MSEILIPALSSGPEEIVADRTSAERWPLDADVIRRFKNPWTCPAHLLGWLAHEQSVDLWNDDWPDEKKRRVIARSIALHRIKGTKAAIREGLSVVDARLLQDVTFPARAFVSPTISKAQRDAWLARMPQIRIYEISERRARGLETFARSDPPESGRASYVGHAFARTDRAWEITGRRSILRLADGTEQPLRHVEIRDVERPGAPVVDQVRIPGNGRPGVFVGGFARGRFLTRGRKAPTTATVRLRDGTERSRELHFSTLAPGFEPIDLEYQLVAERRLAGPAAFIGRFARARFGRFLTRDRARETIYQMVHLHDPSVDAPWVRAHSFVGHARTPKPPFHSEMLVEALSRKPRRAAIAGRSIVGRSFLVQADLAMLRWALLAGRSMKAGRDRVHFDTTTRRTLRFGDRPKLDGAIRFGRAIRKTL